MSEVIVIFKALSDPTRLAVFNCIRSCGSSYRYPEAGDCFEECVETAACDIRSQVACAPSTLTHHLNELRDAGLIETEKRGRSVYCRVKTGALEAVSAFASGAAPTCGE